MSKHIIKDTLTKTVFIPNVKLKIYAKLRIELYIHDVTFFVFVFKACMYTCMFYTEYIKLFKLHMKAITVYNI